MTAILPIAVDGMGGDKAPGEIIEGARRAADELGVPVVLVGRPEELGTDHGLEVFYTLTREQPSGWMGYSRRIDNDLLREIAWPASDDPQVFVCGSTRFVDAAADGLVALGYDPLSIKTERFGATGG